MSKAQKIADHVQAFLTPLLGPLGAPLRAFYLAIGHSTVASAFILGAFAYGIGLTWTWSQEDMWGPVARAQAANTEANQRMTELRIVEKSLELGVEESGLIWYADLGTVEYNEVTETLRVVTVPLSGATEMILSWRGYRGTQGSGTMTSNVAVGSDGRSNTGFSIGTAWVPGGSYSISLFQELPGGRRARWQASGMVVEVPL